MTKEYIINLRNAPDDIKDGDLALIRLDTTRYSDFRSRSNTALGRIHSISGSSCQIDILNAPNMGTVAARRPGGYSSNLGMRDKREIQLVTVSALETDDTSVVYEYLDRIFNERYDTSGLVVYIESVDANGIMGRILSTDAPSRFDQFPNSDSNADSAIDEITRDWDVPFDIVGRTIIFSSCSVNLKPAANKSLIPQNSEIPIVSPGDLVVASRFKLEFEDGALAADLYDVFTLGNFTDVHDAVAFARLDKQMANSEFATSASVYVLDRKLAEAHARTEPDRAFAIFYESEGWNGETETKGYVFGSEGYEAMMADDVQSYLESHGVSPGLWVLDDLKIHSSRSYEGEYDAEIDGDWRPATSEDIEYWLGSMDSADAEIADVLDIEPEPGIARRYMAMAENAHFEEQFEIDRAKFAAAKYGISKGSVHSNTLILNDWSAKSYCDTAALRIADNSLSETFRLYAQRAIQERSSVLVETSLEPEEQAKVDEIIPSLPNSMGKEAYDFSSDQDFYLRIAKFQKIFGKSAKMVHFIPDADLESDMALLANLINENESKFLTSRFSTHTSYSDIFKIAGVKARSAVDLPVFSHSDYATGSKDVRFQWHLDSQEEIPGVLVLANDKGKVVARYSLALSRLTNEFGLALNRNMLSNSGIYNTDQFLIDLDRVVCEATARIKIKPHDISNPLNNGAYETREDITYISNGVIHNDFGPAVVQSNGTETYYFRGNVHRKNGPAIVGPFYECWMQHGLQQRTDGPSMVRGDLHHYRVMGKLHRLGGPANTHGHVEEWVLDGVTHRESGAAIDVWDGTKKYYRNGVLHNLHGPAIIHANGEKEFFVRGASVDEDTFERLFSQGDTAAPKSPSPAMP